MITVYIRKNGALAALPLTAGSPLPEDAVWIDLLSPTSSEEDIVEAVLGLNPVSYTHLTLPTIYSV